MPIFSKLKQFKDMRDKAKSLQTSLATEKVEGSAAWGKLKIEMDGNLSVLGVSLSEELLTSGKDKLESAIKEAVNDAVKKAQRKMVDKMRASGDLKMPGLG
jgi:DNA-binding YbaB/EbfC family protein